jgi:2-polyprenyl-6-methoxyphenol hydroxylase-like FAD-dependent oxidoreductase
VADVDRILIAGGGIAGLCLAAALGRHGFAAELVERSPDWPVAGAGIALHANAGRVLRMLGLGDAIGRAAAPLPRWAFLDQRGNSSARPTSKTCGARSAPAWASPGSGCRRSWWAQSRIAAQTWVLPPAQRDAVLRERGDQLLRDRYRPLIAAP